MKILPPSVADKIRRGHPEKIIGSRVINTDKNRANRTKDNPLPVKAKSRMIVRGGQEDGIGTFRRDSPTGTAFSQHFLLQVAASLGLHLFGADAENAYFQGDPMDRMTFINPR